MSIWTQVFLVNLIVFVSWAWIDRSLFNDRMEEWIEEGIIREWVFVFYIMLTIVSFPAWLIYLVVA